MVLVNGTYFIRSISGFPSSPILDVREGRVVTGQSVIGFNLHGGQNQQWVVQVNGSTCTLAPRGNTALFARPDRLAHGGKIVLSEFRQPYEWVEVMTGTYQLRVEGQNLVFMLPLARNLEEAEVQNTPANNDLWVFDRLGRSTPGGIEQTDEALSAADI